MREAMVPRISNRRGDHDFVSRDWKHVVCAATGCRWNIVGECAVPSRCEIQDDGRCKGFETPLMKPKLDGD
jgi:hypothetical protein